MLDPHRKSERRHMQYELNHRLLYRWRKKVLAQTFDVHNGLLYETFLIGVVKSLITKQ